MTKALSRIAGILCAFAGAVVAAQQPGSPEQLVPVPAGSTQRAEPAARIAASAGNASRSSSYPGNPPNGSEQSGARSPNAKDQKRSKVQHSGYTTTWPSSKSDNVQPVLAVELADETLSLNQSDVDKLVAAVNEASDIDEEQKKETLERLKGATDWLKTATDADVKSKEYQADIDNAESALQETKAALAESRGEPQFDIPDDAALSLIEQQAAEATTRLQQARAALDKSEELLKRRGERKAELAKLVAEMGERLEEARKVLALPADDSSLLSVARRRENEARYIALEKQKTLFPIELKRIDARAELLPLRRDLAKREVAYLEKETAGWQKIVADVRKRESDRQAVEARRRVQDAHPALKGLAEQNASFAQRHRTLVAAMEKIEKETQRSRQIAEQLKGDFRKLTEKVDKAGHSTTIGLLLRRERDSLPDVSHCRARLRFIAEENPRIHLSLLDLRDVRASLADLDAEVAQVVDQLKSEIRPDDQQYIKRMVVELLQSRRDMLDKLIGDHNKYIQFLGELEITQQALLDESSKLLTYIDERVLWTRSSEPIGPTDLRAALAGLKTVVRPAPWLGLGEVIRQRISERPWAAALGAFTAGLLLLCRRRLRTRIDCICQMDEDELRYRILPTAEAVLALLLAAAFWPGVMWVAGRQLMAWDTTAQLGRACGQGLQNAAFTFWIAAILLQLCRTGGVGERHFDWNSEALRVLRRNVTWLSILGIPVVFIVAAVIAFQDGRWAASLGRLGFLVGCFQLALFSHLVLRPNGGVFRGICRVTPKEWFCQARHFFYLFGVGVPIVLAVVSSLGYDYSAQHLAVRAESTFAIALAVMLVRAVALRWLAVRRERFLRDAMAGNIEQDPESSEMPPAHGAAVLSQVGDGAPNLHGDAVDGQELAVSSSDQPTAEMQETDSQVRYLLRYVFAILLLGGGYLIWADITPALGVLDRVTLWSRYVELTELIPDADGSARRVTTQQEVPTTLKHAVVAGSILLLGLVLARSLPALLEVLVLERMPVDRGQRYAAGLILRYVVTLAGMTIACRELGFTWSSIQWLAAAMTVGLGFGMQEIFANLVSGLIILFERPVRVGDLVTVGGVTGRVTRMQIRATTITDYDRRELIVPNKKFITDDVMNWTLSDHINRVVVEVGVAYGTDVRRARELMLRVARRHPQVLKEPQPSVTFDKFADSALNFTLRCFLPNLDDRLGVIHELHAEIDREFRQAEIEIPFPQQDLHVRTIDTPTLNTDLPRNDAA